MCNDERRNEVSGSCVGDVIRKIIAIQRQDIRREEEFEGCEKPFLGPTRRRDCFNTRPIQLFNCCTGTPWDVPFVNRRNGEEERENNMGRRSAVFRAENVENNCCTCRILERTSDNCFRDTNDFITIKLDCVGAIQCLPDVHVDLCQ